MRVYVPYGDEWYGYLVRRMAERPANLEFFLRAVATKKSQCSCSTERSGPLGDTVAVLGAGKMGEALLSGMLRAGRAADDLLVTARRPARAKDLAERYGVRAVTNAEAAAGPTRCCSP